MRTIEWDVEYRRSAARILSICRRYVGNEEVAKDLVQEVFLTAMEFAHTYAGRGAWDAWLNRIAVNAALKYLRKQKSAPQTQTLQDDFDSESEEVTDSWMSRLSKRWTIANADLDQQQMLGLIASLPEHHRTVFNLYVMDHHSHKAIAQMLGITESTSKSHLLRARQRIQNELYQLAMAQENKTQKKRILAVWWFFLLGTGARLRAANRASGTHAASQVLPEPSFATGMSTSVSSAWTATAVVTTVVCGVGLYGAGLISGVAIAPMINPETSVVVTAIEAEMPQTSTITVADSLQSDHADTSIKQPITFVETTLTPIINSTKSETKTERPEIITEKIKIVSTLEKPMNSETKVINAKSSPLKSDTTIKTVIIKRQLVYDTIYVEPETSKNETPTF